MWDRNLRMSAKFGDPALIVLFYAGDVRAALVAANAPIILTALLLIGTQTLEFRHLRPIELGELKIEIY